MKNNYVYVYPQTSILRKHSQSNSIIMMCVVCVSICLQFQSYDCIKNLSLTFQKIKIQSYMMNVNTLK